MMFEQWVDNQLERSGESTLAVQTVRNIIMANSVFISALLVLLGIVIGFYPTIFPQRSELILGLNLGFTQLSLILIIISFSLFNFIMAIRRLVRFTILIGATPSDECKICGMKGTHFTKRTLISAMNHWLFGLRAIFYLVCVIVWLVHPLFFLLATIVITLCLVFYEDIFEEKVHNHSH